MEPKKQKSFSLINDSISCITCVIVYSPVHTLISILLIYSVIDALNVYMYVMYLVFETFWQELPISLACLSMMFRSNLGQNELNLYIYNSIAGVSQSKGQGFNV